MCNVEKTILQHLNIFHFFNEVYLFGSSLDDSRYSNDIDLLLIYKKYSKKIDIEKTTISLYLEKLLNKNLDIIILSEKELEQTRFLDRLYSPYRRII